ncbi:MAG TPA: sigma 54-interacting transcriptional regulator [Desulfotomaculum sp.]|nr:sigma 54-interacting transcriptional regulator [Desulfotomaculum sp.]
MPSRFGVLKSNQPAVSGDAKEVFSPVDLEQVFFNSYDSLLVTDKYGNVIFANPSTKRTMGMESEELIGKNVNDLVKMGVYDRSIAAEAIEKRSVVTGIVKTRMNITLITTSAPVMDENGEIIMVITNARDKDLIDKYLAALEDERAKADRYRTAVEYLSDVELDKRAPVAKSQQMRQVVAICKIVAKTDSTVLLVGESGTGKEVMARYIHRNSLRAREPFIPVNCAAVPHELLESEFFGYVRGAFTGASSQGKAGLFEIADKGTLFLDEIGELPLTMQSKLLRVLETGEIQRLGSTAIIKTNVRVIAATNRDLKAMVSQKLFRSDLYYRLNVIPIYLPPLRERPEDILALAHKFLEEFNRKYGLEKMFTEQAIKAFLKYTWPGNIRELRNVVERLVITTSGDDLYFQNDPSVSGGISSKTENSLPETLETKIACKGTLKSVLEAVEEYYIRQVLSECNGRIGEAARRLGIHRTMLYRKMKKLCPE